MLSVCCATPSAFSRCRREAVQVPVLGGWRVVDNLQRPPSRTQPARATSSSSQSSESSDPKPADLLYSGSAAAAVSSPTSGTAPPSATLSFAVNTPRNMSSESAILTVSDWERLGQHLAAYDELREGVIKKCRDVQKLAKQAVYSLHRGDLEGAAKQLGSAESIAGEMGPTIARYPALRFGSFAAAVEEYVEARAFAVFLAERRLIRSDELPLAEPEEFLGGLLDFTGELNRYAIARATVRDKAAVQQCRDLVDALMGRFLQFDLRNGSLRKKYDSLKYTLKKMESTLYELALMEGVGLKISSEAAAMEPEIAVAEGGEGDS